MAVALIFTAVVTPFEIVFDTVPAAAVREMVGYGGWGEVSNSTQLQPRDRTAVARTATFSALNPDAADRGTKPARHTRHARHAQKRTSDQQRAGKLKERS